MWPDEEVKENCRCAEQSNGEHSGQPAVAEYSTEVRKSSSMSSNRKDKNQNQQIQQIQHDCRGCDEQHHVEQPCHPPSAAGSSWLHCCFPAWEGTVPARSSGWPQPSKPTARQGCVDFSHLLGSSPQAAEAAGRTVTFLLAPLPLAPDAAASAASILLSSVVTLASRPCMMCVWD